jgi:hypothetical protein
MPVDPEGDARCHEFRRSWRSESDCAPGRPGSTGGALSGGALIESGYHIGGPVSGLAPEVIAWYREMSPTWLGAEPLVRRQLILRTHRWIVERALACTSEGSTEPLADLAPGAALATALTATVPPDELPRWRTWIRLVVNDLRRALSWPAAERSQAWTRWLFLIPYSIPITRTLAATKRSS